jgi:predicted GIY-YIG superfamily endonuclease
MVDRTGPTDLYRQYDKDENLLYIGISINARARHVSHKASSGWVKEVATIRIESYPTRAEADKAEREAIAKEQPLYNSQHATYRRPKTVYVVPTRECCRTEDGKRSFMLAMILM